MESTKDKVKDLLIVLAYLSNLKNLRKKEISKREEASSKELYDSEVP